jgi:type VI secretion system protein ImpK
MSGDNPFAEPEDSDRTVIRPAPGGRRATPPPPPPGFTPLAPPPPREDAAPLSEAELPSVGGSPLLAAAAPLLQLLARLRNTLSQPDPGDLLARAVRELRGFEQAARTANIPMEQLRPAHYALCASLDDVVLNTPWGSQGAWATRSLVSTFHQEVRSGERFFDILNQAKQNPGTLLPVLELMYLCLSLGFAGRTRLSPRGPAELDRIREETFAVIQRHRKAAEPGLSPHWQGVAAPYRPARASLPVWVAAAAGLACIAGLFVWFSVGLNESSDALYERMLASPPSHMPTITRASLVPPPPPAPGPPPAEPTVLDKLRAFLKPEIDQGLVTVVGTDAVPVVRIAGRGMYASGAANVQPRFLPLLARIAAALKEERGHVDVIGYTDNQPIRTVAFPSNFQLSAARAKSAAALLARGLDDPARLSTEGRADADPIAPNTTAEGREANRRIEVVLHRQT